MEHFIHISKTKKPFLIGLLMFFLTIILTQYLAYQEYLISKNLKIQKIINEANNVKVRLEISLSNSLSATKTLAFIVEEYGVPKNFNSIAKEILRSNKYIDAMELTKEGVITEVYPLEGNEEAIGYNILNDPLRNKEAFNSIIKKEFSFAGPLKLKQGGIAVVGRLPIFIDNDFKGFSAVIIKLSTLLKAAGIENNVNSEFVYQLSKVDPNTNVEEYFLPNFVPNNKEYSVFVNILYGDWKLYVKQKNDEHFPISVITISFLGFILSIILGSFSFYLIRQPEKLNKLVEIKTNELLIANKELAFRNDEKERRAAELILINRELEKAEGYQKQYIQGLKEMMFMTSHKIRQPVAHILGIANILDSSISYEDLSKLVSYMKESALSIDAFTQELTTYIHELELKEKNKNRLEK